MLAWPGGCACDAGPAATWLTECLAESACAVKVVRFGPRLYAPGSARDCVPVGRAGSRSGAGLSLPGVAAAAGPASEVWWCG